MASLLLLKSILFANAYQKSKKRKINKTHKTKKKLEMCRICNDEKGDIPIFNNYIQPNIPEEIQNFSGVTINESDKQSKHMCQNCLNLLNGCIMFRELCQRTNKKMIEMSIKRENNTDVQTYEESNEVKEDSEDYNIPSPAFSDENLGLWGCTTCSKQFTDMVAYNSHLNNCMVEMAKTHKPPEEATKRKFLCDICGKTAFSHAGLLVHMNIHGNVFPFKCDVCPYQGRTMDLLKVHKRSHLVDKPFKCSQCPKATTTSSNLTKHMRHVHSTTRPYKCNYCDKAFSYQHDMKRHIKDIHLRQGTVECDVCYKKFNTKKILQGHRWKIHKIKGERQGRLPSYLQCQMEEQPENGCTSDLYINNRHYNVSDTYNLEDSEANASDANYDKFDNLFFVESGLKQEGYYFDAYIVTPQGNAPTKIPGLPEGATYSIAIDRKNAKVYFGTGQGVYIYNYESSSATEVNRDNMQIDMISIDTEGNKYISESKAGQEEIFRLDGDKKTHVTSLDALNELTIDSNNNFYYIKERQLFVSKSAESSPVCLGNVTGDGTTQIAIPRVPGKVIKYKKYECDTKNIVPKESEMDIK